MAVLCGRPVASRRDASFRWKAGATGSTPSTTFAAGHGPRTSHALSALIPSAVAQHGSSGALGEDAAAHRLTHRSRRAGDAQLPVGCSATLSRGQEWRRSGGGLACTPIDLCHGAEEDLVSAESRAIGCKEPGWQRHVFARVWAAP